MKHKLEIKPAINPEERHKIEDTLKELGYDVHGGGTHADLSACDISFSRDEGGQKMPCKGKGTKKKPKKGKKS